MYIVAMQSLQLREFARVDLLRVQRPYREPLTVSAVRLQDPADWLAGGLARRWRFLRKLRECAALSFVGADLLDGYCSPAESLHNICLTALAAALGLRTRVLGLSCNASPAPAAVAALAAQRPAVVLNCREPGSHPRVEAAIGRPARLAADYALLLEPAASGPAACTALA
jgi:polysaccharide pyruvyl transferase WcaK-like protein